VITKPVARLERRQSTTGPRDAPTAPSVALSATSMAADARSPRLLKAHDDPSSGPITTRPSSLADATLAGNPVSKRLLIRHPEQCVVVTRTGAI
jgi:hypothetical protein